MLAEHTEQGVRLARRSIGVGVEPLLAGEDEVDAIRPRLDRIPRSRVSAGAVLRRQRDVAAIGSSRAAGTVYVAGHRERRPANRAEDLDAVRH